MWRVVALSLALFGVGMTQTKPLHPLKTHTRSRLAALHLQSASKSVPQKINLQGYLTDNSGNPVNGDKPMEFSIWTDSTGGSQVWTSGTQTVSVDSGIFIVNLPVPAEVFTPGSRRWLEISVESTPLSPRIEITSSPWSYRTLIADSATNTAKISGLTINDLDTRFVNDNSGEVGTEDLENGSVTEEKLAENSVSSSKIQNGSIREEDLAFPVGKITEIIADDGLDGGGDSGVITLGVNTTTGIRIVNDSVGFDISWGDSRYLRQDQEFNGDVSGTASGITVTGLQGRPLSSASPSTGNVLKWNGSSWTPSPDNTGESYWQQSGLRLYPSDQSWRVGIGTSNPSEKLEVNGTILASQNIVANQDISAGDDIEVEDDLQVGGDITTDGDIFLSGSGSQLRAENVNLGAPVIRINNSSTSGSYEVRGIEAEVQKNVAIEGNSQNGTGVSGEGYGTYGTGIDGTGYKYGVYGWGFGRDRTSYGVYSSGNFAASGSKAAIVRTSTGPRELYTIESPEIWFEDFGTSRLQNGHAHVELDPLFLETVTIDEEHPMMVFIQLNGNCNGVYVVKGKSGFDVFELNGGTSNVPFDYRVVAKRKGYENIRMREEEDAYLDRFLYPVDNDPQIPERFKRIRKEHRRR